MLRKIGAWDPHNVTEDADLGIRLYRRGFRAEVLDSTTYEEAACQPGNWLRQRTRWLKGWVQTYGVHMRQPFRLARELGIGGFLAFQGHFAGIIISALVHPISYAIILHDALSGIMLRPAQGVFGHQLCMIALFNLVAGYAASLALGFFVLRGKRGRGAGAAAHLHPDLLAVDFGGRLSRGLPTDQSAALLGEDRTWPDAPQARAKAKVASMTDPSTDADGDVVAFWFSEAAKPRWFARDDAFDAELRQRFGPLLAQARRGELAHWAEHPDGALALVILLDQVSRNIHRGTPEAFAGDGLALDCAKDAIARGFDLAVAPDRRVFFYVPFEHAEKLADQERGVALFEALGDENYLGYMRRHRDIVARFGRFPHRNAILGRISTPEEIEFLKQPGSSF